MPLNKILLNETDKRFDVSSKNKKITKKKFIFIITRRLLLFFKKKNEMKLFKNITKFQDSSICLTFNAGYINKREKNENLQEKKIVQASHGIERY